MPPKKPPLAPTALTATALSPTEVHLAWTDRANNESRVGIERAIGDENFAPIAEVAKNVTEFDARQLQPNTTYRFRVRGFNNYGASPYSNFVVVTTPALPVPDPPPVDPTEEPTEPPPIVIPPPDPIPIPPPSSGKRLLTAAAIEYLGLMRVPAQGVDMQFSAGTLALRKVNDVVHLLMTGSAVQSEPVGEFEDTGVYHADVNQAPRMRLVKDWGDIYGQSRKTWLLENGVWVERNPQRRMGGLHWNDSTQLLYWTYYDTYNVNGYEDWSLGATRLDAAGPVAFGPWRVTGGGKKGPWRCREIHQHPVTGELLCGSGIASGNISSPWGPDIWGLPFPTEATPSGFTAPDLPAQKYLTYYPMIGKIDPATGRLIPNADGTLPPIRAARRAPDYIYEPFTYDGSATEIDPQVYGVGSWTQLDVMGGYAWIDLDDVEGVICTGRQAAGHLWYRSAGMGSTLCTHGVASPVDVTGPVSTDAYPTIWIYKPDDLYNVRRGVTVDYTVEPTERIQAEQAYGLITGSLQMSGGSRALGGCCVDRETRKLYVTALNADSTIPGLVNPVVHVFQIH